MKHLLLLVAALLPEIAWAEPGTAVPPPADIPWAQVRELSSRALEGGGPRPRQVKRFQAVAEEADAFARHYPEDTRHWEAQLIALHSRMHVMQLTGGSSGAEKTDGDAMRAILAAPEASLAIRDEAAFLLQFLQFHAVEPTRTAQVSAFLKEANIYQREYGASQRAPEVAQWELLLISASNPPEAVEVLRALAEHPDAAVAHAARRQLTEQERRNRSESTLGL